MGWSKEHYMKRYPSYNRVCPICGETFNALHAGSKRRKTCSKKCSKEYTKRVQRENTRRYIKTEKYLAYRKKYYEAVKARRRIAKIARVLAGACVGKAAGT
nr:hypothetical protein [Candidatus Sigynarchaeota archaeon]